MKITKWKYFIIETCPRRAEAGAAAHQVAAVLVRRGRPDHGGLRAPGGRQGEAPATHCVVPGRQAGQ